MVLFLLLNTSLPEPHKKKKLKQKTQKLLQLLTYQNDPLRPPSLLHWFLAFFPSKTGGRLRIVLPNFPSRVARSGLHLWLVLVKFIPHQSKGILVRWLQRSKYQLNYVLFLFVFNVPSDGVYKYNLGYYVAWGQTLGP